MGQYKKNPQIKMGHQMKANNYKTYYFMKPQARKMPEMSCLRRTLKARTTNGFSHVKEKWQINHLAHTENKDACFNITPGYKEKKYPLTDMNSYYLCGLKKLKQKI